MRSGSIFGQTYVLGRRQYTNFSREALATLVSIPSFHFICARSVHRLFFLNMRNSPRDVDKWWLRFTFMTFWEVDLRGSLL
jgi:hypothetical protein